MSHTLTNLKQKEILEKWFMENYLLLSHGNIIGFESAG